MQKNNHPIPMSRQLTECSLHSNHVVVINKSEELSSDRLLPRYFYKWKSQSENMAKKARYFHPSRVLWENAPVTKDIPDRRETGN